ncbi:MAG: PQQ-dependent sugar dehydrogenase [Bacteroidetes bacterium]|nr:PQQ-dependent sugar dehydrogenase [Bacteroidota bacterium]
MRIHFLTCVIAALWVTGCSMDPVQAQFEIEVAFANLRFTRPVDLQHAGDGSGRLFVVEQAGVIQVFANDPSVASASVFLDIEDRVDDRDNEEGLLGLAFHPDFANNGFFYVDYTASNPSRTVIARYQVDPNDPNRADRNSEVIVLETGQPAGNHNGGQIAFGPDDFLYIALGDGGGSDDMFGNGQNRSTLLGTILRIDVDNSFNDRNYGIPADNPFVGGTQGFREEIYAYGLRNPWRFSFDPVTDLLWTGDVGQNSFEEIDIVENGGNYGWNTMEGFHCFSPSSGCNQSGLVLPVVEYGRSEGRSVTGGFVYRGPGVPELIGQYIYGDFLSGRIWALEYDGQQVVQNTELLNTSLGIASFGVDENNELYICAFDGRIHRFVPTSSTNIGEAAVPEAPVRLHPNHPNPFHDTTTIRFDVSETSRVNLFVYDLLGRQVANVVEGVVTAGEHTATFTPRGLPSGAYIFRLDTPQGTFTKTMLLLK